VQVKCDELELWGDEDRLVQVLVNLISNAIKHCNGSPVLVTAADGEGFVEFGVKDEGDGIDASQQTAIFERFRQITTNSAGKTGNNGSNGTGLGLPIAKTLVEQHSGTIGVESVPGSGSYFWFRLPKRRCDSH
jgi:signal transduction histidine kinase